MRKGARWFCGWGRWRAAILAVLYTVGLGAMMGAVVPSAAAAAAGTTIYVATSGSDITGNGSQTAPYATVSHAVYEAVYAAQPVTVAVEPGTYDGTVTISSDLTLTTDPSPTVAGSPVVIDATGDSNGIVIEGNSASGTTVEGLTVENAAKAGIVAESTSNLTIENDVVEANDQSCAGFTDCNNPASNNGLPRGVPGSNVPAGGTPFTATNAVPCGNSGGSDCESLHLIGVTNSTVTGNTVQNNLDGGIYLTDESGPTTGNTISDNVVANNAVDCGITLASHAGNGVNDNTVEGNTSEGNGAAGIILATPVPNGVVTGNIISGNTVENNDQGGIVLHTHAPGSNVSNDTVENNTVSGNQTDPMTGTGEPEGIDADGAGAEITGLTITGNTISDEYYGVYLDNAAASTLSSNSISVTSGGMATESLTSGTATAASGDSVTVGGNGSATPDTTVQATGGTGTVTLAVYNAAAPTETTALSNPALYFDLQLSPNSNFASVEVTECGNVATGDTIEWWTGSTWQTVSAPPTYSGNCVAFTVSSQSTPNLTQLSGTPFAVETVSATSGGVGGVSSSTGLPVVTGVSPSSGSDLGGTAVTVTGSNFDGATAVDFGGVAAESFSVVSDTEITAVSPGGTTTVDVTVVGPDGTSATSSADEFTYLLPSSPGVSSVTTSSPTAPVSSVPQSFSDVPAGFWAAGAISQLSRTGVISGFPDGTFRPNDAVTRAEFVKMLVLVSGLKLTAQTTPFTDVAAGDWFAPYVAAAVQAGLVDGTTPTTFDPNGTLTREEMAVLLARALNLSARTTLHFSDDAQIDGWALGGVEEAVAAGYIHGFPNGTFEPLGTTTRAQAATVLAAVQTHLNDQ